MDDTEPGPQGAPPDLDARLERAIEKKEQELRAAGTSETVSARLAAEYGTSRLLEIAARSLDPLRSDLTDRLDALDEAETEYRAKLIDHWSDALDTYRLAYEGCKLVGIRLHRRAMEEDRDDLRTDLQSAMTGTWARSVRTGAEIDVLLRSGFPRGAAARARTLHELAVSAFVLSHFGLQEEHSDLGSRYVAYGAVKVWRDAQEYQQKADRLGVEPLPPKELLRYEEEFEVAVREHSDLQRVNGWAARLPGYSSGSFKELEQMAGLDHYRPYYSWFSHEVHSNVEGDRLNMVDSPNGSAYHLGLRMDGLAAPAQAALRATHQVVAAWASILELKAMDVVLLQASRLLVDEAADTFAAAEAALQNHRPGDGTGRRKTTMETEI